MTNAEFKNAAEAAVKNAEKGSSGFHATSLVENLNGGTLVVVDYKDSDKDEVESYVYFDGDNPTVFGDTEGFARFMAGQAQPGIWKLLSDPSKIGGVSGIVAILITISLCWKFAHTQGNAFDVPPVITNAWTVIIGFYFGSQTKR